MQLRPLEYYVWMRLCELEERLDAHTWDRFGRQLAAHSPEAADVCPLCSEEAPCPVLRSFAVVLRAYELRRAVRALEAFADEVREKGGEILTVLRRPQLDSVSGRENALGVERFGFELVYPHGALGITATGHTAEEHRLGRSLRDEDSTAPSIARVGLSVRQDWAQLVPAVAEELGRIKRFAAGAAA